MKQPKQYVVFYDQNDTEIYRMTVEGIGEGEIEETIGLLAYERGIEPASISFAFVPI